MWCPTRPGSPRLQLRPAVVARDERAEIAGNHVDVVVVEPTHAAADDEMLVVQAVFAATAAGAEKAQVPGRILAAVLIQRPMKIVRLRSM